MKKTPPVVKGVGKPKAKAPSEQPDDSSTDELKPTGVKVGEEKGHQSRRAGFFQTRHGTKK